MSPRRASSLRRRRNSSEVPSSPPTPGNPRLVPLKRAVAIRRRVARDGGAFVLTNGVFDLLHPGHASFLEAARRLAGRKGKLFVALNSDQSTRRLKGPRRPIMDEGSRAYTLAQLRSVDGVVIFRGKRLAREIAALKPDVYCKAGDYTLARLDPSERAALEAAGSKIVFLPFLRGFSTTRLVRRIKAAGSVCRAARALSSSAQDAAPTPRPSSSPSRPAGWGAPASWRFFPTWPTPPSSSWARGSGCRPALSIPRLSGPSSTGRARQGSSRPCRARGPTWSYLRASCASSSPRAWAHSRAGSSTCIPASFPAFLGSTRSARKAGKEAGMQVD